jgi:hypothetical protein
LSPEIAGQSDVLDTVGSIFAQYVGASDAGGRRGGGSRRHARSDEDDEEDAGDRRVGRDDQSRSLVGSLTGEEIRRLGRLWRDMRAGQDGHAPGSPDDSASKQALLDREAARAKSHRSGDIHDRARFLELQLVRAREETASLQGSYRDSITKLKECMAVLEEKDAALKDAVAGQDAAASRLAAVDAQREALYNKSLANLHEYERDSAAKQAAINEAERSAEELRVRLQAVTIDLDRARQRAMALEADAASASHQEAAAATELERMRADAEAMASEATSAAQMRALVRHLRADNARLVRLLASTKEYSSFATETFPQDDAEDSGRLRSSYLAPAAAPGHPLDDGLYGGPTARDGSAEREEVARMRRHYAQEADHDQRRGLPVPASSAAAAFGKPASRRGRSASRSRAVRSGSARGQQQQAASRRSVGGGGGGGGGAVSRRHRSGSVGPAAAGASSSSSSSAMLHRGMGAGSELGVGPSVSELAAAEGLHWVPSDAMRVVALFRRRYLASLPADEVRDFMRDLNRAWKDRQARTSKLLKAKYSTTISELKRALQQRQPYREVLQASTISRLHTELTAVRYAVDGVLEPGPSVYRRSRRSASHGPRGAPIEDQHGATYSDLVMAGGGGSATAGGGGHSGGAAAGGDYGWAPQWSWHFPGATGGALGHSTADGWTPAREHAALMERALATVDALSRQVAELEEEKEEQRQRISRLRARGGEPVTEEEEEAEAEAADHARRAARLAVARARLTSHTRAVTWFGGQIVRMADGLGEEVDSLTSALRQTADAGGGRSAGPSGEVGIDGSAVRRLATEVDKAVASYRAQCRRAFETGLEAGADEDRYGGILGRAAGPAEAEDEAVVEAAAVAASQSRSRSASPDRQAAAPSRAGRVGGSASMAAASAVYAGASASRAPTRRQAAPGRTVRANPSAASSRDSSRSRGAQRREPVRASPNALPPSGSLAASGRGEMASTRDIWGGAATAASSMPPPPPQW